MPRPVAQNFEPERITTRPVAALAVAYRSKWPESVQTFH